MYVWLWRALPGGLVGKLVLSTVLAAAFVALLFLVVFPALEPLLPLGDVTVDRQPAPPTAPAPS
jgi:hypothetical protein